MPLALPEHVVAFCNERHLATLTTARANGSPHVVPVGFTLDPADGSAWVITSGTSVKARNAARGERAVLCQLDGRRWISLEGRTRVLDEPSAVAEAERRYALRYRVPRPNPLRVVVELRLDRLLGGTWPLV